MVSAFSFGIRQNEQKKEADKAAEVEKAEFFCEINTKKKRKNIGVGLEAKKYWSWAGHLREEYL